MENSSERVQSDLVSVPNWQQTEDTAVLTRWTATATIKVSNPGRRMVRDYAYWFHNWR